LKEFEVLLDWIGKERLSIEAVNLSARQQENSTTKEESSACDFLEP
jgi:hypothetical protein